MLKSVVIFRIIIIFILASCGAACDISPSTQAVSDYDKLCKIYTEIVNDQSSQTKKFSLLTERIRKEIPDIYVLYQNAALVDQKDKYQFYKEAAKKATNRPWECAVMKSYYSGEFVSD